MPKQWCKKKPLSSLSTSISAPNPMNQIKHPLIEYFFILCYMSMFFHLCSISIILIHFHVPFTMVHKLMNHDVTKTTKNIILEKRMSLQPFWELPFIEDSYYCLIKHISLGNFIKSVFNICIFSSKWSFTMTSNLPFTCCQGYKKKNPC